MRRSTIFLILFVILAAAVIGVSQLLRTQPPVQLTLAVDPLAAEWINASVSAFNASDRAVIGTQRVAFVVTEVSDVSVWRGQVTWNSSDHPLIWIPASSISLTYANLPFETVTDSLARTLLVWGGYRSRVEVLTGGDGQALDWPALQTASATDGGNWQRLGGRSNWGFLRFAIAPPESSMAGVAALLSASAAYSETPTLTGVLVSGADFRQWFLPVVDSVPRNIVNNPAVFIAQGVSNAQIALGPESYWLSRIDALTSGSDPVHFSYPAYNIVFDFPLVRWNDPDETPQNRQAAEALAAWLLAADQQRSAEAYGLRPAAGTPSAAVFSQGSAAGIQIDLPAFSTVQAPTRNETQSLMQWFIQNR